METSKEFVAITARIDRLDGQLAMTLLVLKELLKASSPEVREQAFEAASRSHEIGVAKSLGSAHASEAFLRGIEIAAKMFGLQT